MNPVWALILLVGAFGLMGALLYVYFPDGRLAGVDQYLADGTLVSSLPVE
ncbi:MAG: hypothetical protein GWO38_07255 [Phycisphaerae bacterium]|nr:hypothetical protein [Phycisphaerae bacterium]NIX27423.1 hypothetical protein [Phycisphaerae bacterium]